MKKNYTLKENYMFSRLYSKGKKIVCPYFIIYFRYSKKEYSRIGITVSKKIGCAVKRNRSKRLIRESYRLIKNQINKNCDIVFVIRSGAPDASINNIKDDMIKAFIKAQIINNVL